MRPYCKPITRFVLFLTCWLLCTLQSSAQSLPKTQQAWTLESAINRWQQQPSDPYLQFVVLQLASRENRLDHLGKEMVERLYPKPPYLGLDDLRNRRQSVSLFSLFSGSLAIQESLQLDVMLGVQDEYTWEKHNKKKITVYHRAEDVKEITVAFPPGGAEGIGFYLPSVSAHSFAMVPWSAMMKPHISIREEKVLTDVPLKRTITHSFFQEPIPGWKGKMDLSLFKGRKRSIQLERTPKRIQIGDDSIAGYKLLSPKKFSLVGREVGNTKLTIWFPNAEDPKKEDVLAYSVHVVAEPGITTLSNINLTVSSPGASAPANVQWPILIHQAMTKQAHEFVHKQKLISGTEQSEEPPAARVKLSELEGPTLKSHPWKKMLGRKNPHVSELSRCVPVDFYLAEFRTLEKFCTVMHSNEMWGKHLLRQSLQEAKTLPTTSRYLTQLALSLDDKELVKHVDNVAITGSDLFFSNGTDITVLLQLKDSAPESLRQTLMHQTKEALPKGERITRGDILGVPYTYFRTADQTVNVYCAMPKRNLYVCSNSGSALKRVLTTFRTTDDKGRRTLSLGESDEFRYIRTLMPLGAKEEDGLIYMSDPFIRHMVGPKLKLSQRRRLIAISHLRMIGYAAQLYRTQFGQSAKSLSDLVSTGCCPEFNKGQLRSPLGGTYSLSEDGSHGVCSVCGTIRTLKPICDLPLNHVNILEAEAYKEFLDNYNEYWRDVFDPIAIRIADSGTQYRTETIILPLIDNSVYTEMSKFFGGKAISPEALPVPVRNLFSMNLAIDPNYIEELLSLKENRKEIDGLKDVMIRHACMFTSANPLAGFPAGISWFCVEETKPYIAKEGSFLLGDIIAYQIRAAHVVDKGIDHSFGLHVYDTEIHFDHDFFRFFGELFGSDPQEAGGAGAEAVFIAFPFMSAFAPAYMSVPVKDEKLVDDFLAETDRMIGKYGDSLAEMWGNAGIGIDYNFYKLTTKSKQVIRACSIRIGPAKMRFFWGRVGNGLYLTNQPYIFDDLLEASKKPVANKGLSGHAMFRLRADRWNKALAGYQLGWAESNRNACLKNLGPLSSAGRAYAATHKKGKLSWNDREVLPYARGMFGFDYQCPDGGKYMFNADGTRCTCSIHGSYLEPRQRLTPAEDSELARLMRQFTNLSAALTFTDQGLRAVVVVEKRGK